MFPAIIRHSLLTMRELDDREFPTIKANHRQHMKEKANFKQIIPIPSDEIVQKIKQTYRVQFLKDVALARLLDDSTFTTLNSVIYFNHIDIVNYFQQNDEFLSQLFKILTSSEEPEQRKKDVVMFLHELCSIAKTLQVANRGVFYRYSYARALIVITHLTKSKLDRWASTDSSPFSNTPCQIQIFNFVLQPLQYFHPS
jgi:hypothetical protein